MRRGESADVPGVADRKHTLLRWARNDRVLLTGVLAVAAIARAAYVVFAGQTRFDPWRHLALVRNLREGPGFTLFDGQPYLWHGPVWHWLCSLAPASIRSEWLAVAASLASVALVYALAGAGIARAQDRRQASLATGLLVALCGPVIAYTCHLGPEALALGAALFALWLCTAARGDLVAWIAGSAFGLAVVLRTNVALLFPLALPPLGTPRRLVAFGIGGALPLLATWLRNHSILSSHPWVFTWDGLATPSDSFGPLSTLVLQLHPDVAEGLRRLHERTMPVPEWIQRPDGMAWELMLLMLCGVLAVVLSRSAALIATTALALGYTLLLDDTLSSNHFRIYLPLLPVFFLAVGRLAAVPGRSRSLAWILVALMLIGGARSFRSPRMPTLEAATPAPQLLEEDAYMVASGFFHPDSLVHRFPDKRFIGMPLRPDRFDEFRAAFPGYDAILWHSYTVQSELGRHLAESTRWEVVRTGVNSAGRRYSILKETSGRDDAATGAQH